MSILILLAHQDDELGILPIVHNLLANNHTINIIFLTDGAAKSQDSLIRNKESIAVLNRFGIKSNHIHFFADFYQILDKHLVENLHSTQQYLMQYLKDYDITPDMVISHAWEGGHPDHDAGHLLALSVAKEFEILHNCYQFYFYNNQSWSMMGPVRLFHPLRQTLDYVTKFGVMNGIRYFNSYWLYKTQRFSMLWMVPALFSQYVIKRKCSMYLTDIRDIQLVPHKGILRYERNAFYSQHEFFVHARGFINDLSGI